MSNFKVLKRISSSLVLSIFMLATLLCGMSTTSVYASTRGTISTNSAVEPGGGGGDYLLAAWAHVQGIGWQSIQYQDYPWNNITIGTTGQSLRMEAFYMQLGSRAPSGASLQYRAYVQNIGWQSWVSGGEMAGTVGQSLRIEAVQIKLINAGNYHIYYSGHIQGIGWGSDGEDGAVVGTIGQSLRLEALKIQMSF